MTFFIYLCIQEQDKKFVSIKRYHCLYGIISVDFSAEYIVGIVPSHDRKGSLMNVSDRLLLRKRAIVETVNDELKNIVQVEHSRHRCFDNFIVNLLGAIAAYCLFPKKPRINVQRNFDTQLALF